MVTGLNVVVLADVGQATEGESGFGAEAVVEGATRALSNDLGGEDEVRGRLVFEAAAVEMEDVGDAPEITCRSFGREFTLYEPVRGDLLLGRLAVNLAGEDVAPVEFGRLLAEAVADEALKLIEAHVGVGERDVDSRTVEGGFGGEKAVECDEH